MKDLQKKYKSIDLSKIPDKAKEVLEKIHKNTKNFKDADALQKKNSAGKTIEQVFLNIYDKIAKDKPEAIKSATKPKASGAKSRVGRPRKSTPGSLSNLVKKNKKYSAYIGKNIDLKKDAGEPAKKPGKRISKTGKTYYEYRANRMDVRPSRYPRLAKGGAVGDNNYTVEAMYRDGANFKNMYEFHVPKKVADKLKVGEDYESTVFGISQQEWYDNYLPNEYDPEIDHNLLEITSIKPDAKMSQGGMAPGWKHKMAKGGHVSKSEHVWKKMTGPERLDLLEKAIGTQSTPASMWSMMSKEFNFLPREVKIKLDAYTADKEFSQGGAVQKKTLEQALEDFDLKKLNPFESFQYQDMKSRNSDRSKSATLKILINNSGGDVSQLSSGLAKIVKDYKYFQSSGQYDKGGSVQKKSPDHSSTRLAYQKRQDLPGVYEISGLRKDKKYYALVSLAERNTDNTTLLSIPDKYRTPNLTAIIVKDSSLSKILKGEPVMAETSSGGNFGMRIKIKRLGDSLEFGELLESGKMAKGGEISKGLKVEREHDKTYEKVWKHKIKPGAQAAMAVVQDHLKEDPKYYSKLKKAKLKKGGGVDALYERLIDEHNSGGWEKMGTGFDRFLQLKMDGAIEKGDIEYYHQLIDVQNAYDRDFYASGGYVKNKYAEGEWVVFNPENGMLYGASKSGLGARRLMDKIWKSNIGIDSLEMTTTEEYAKQYGSMASGGPIDQAKVGKVMHEFKHHNLHSGKSGKIVKSRKQAVAIALSEGRKAAKSPK